MHSLKLVSFFTFAPGRATSIDPISLSAPTEPNANRRKLKVKCADLNSRFSTQPVTCSEVAEAKKQNCEARTAGKMVDIRNEILESELLYNLSTNKAAKSAATDHVT